MPSSRRYLFVSALTALSIFSTAAITVSAAADHGRRSGYGIRFRVDRDRCYDDRSLDSFRREDERGRRSGYDAGYRAGWFDGAGGFAYVIRYPDLRGVAAAYRRGFVEWFGAGYRSGYDNGIALHAREYRRHVRHGSGRRRYGYYRRW